MPDSSRGLVGTVWATPPPPSTPQVSLINLKYFFSSLAQGLTKHLWSGYFIALGLDKWSLESQDKDTFGSELIYAQEALKQLRTDTTYVFIMKQFQ